uniref:Alkylated DNA repair protein AlkB homologue 8 N-terminal domain-containing protein n=1 Tax=Cyprinus carpio carpio TaxID=630221 RepID=A0A9J7ZN72_CYPCA
MLSGPGSLRALILLRDLLTLSGVSFITWSPGGGGVFCAMLLFCASKRVKKAFSSFSREIDTQKTKEIILDFRRTRNHPHTPIYINEAVVEGVSSFKFLGIHISDDRTWSLNTSTLVKKVQQRLYFLRSLKKVLLSPRILVEFYRCTIESILTNCISVWYRNCSASDRKALQWVVKTAQRITGTQLTTTENIYHKCSLGRARNIIKDASHPNHGLFTLLPSGSHYRSLRSHASRLRKSFFPEAVTLLNSTPAI